MESINLKAPDGEAPKSIKNADRITLADNESHKVSAWLSQINLVSRGFLSLSKSDIVNFILREHKSELTPKEIQRIRNDNYDPMKHLNLIAPQIKRALAENDLERVAELQQELRGVELSVIHQTHEKSSNRKSGSQRRRRKIATSKDANESEIASHQGIETVANDI